MKSIVIMPFYNEEANSKFYTEEIILTFNKSNCLEFDYLLIDDCSVDNTFQELEKIIDKFDNVNLKGRDWSDFQIPNIRQIND